jgi:hypothetical protein
MVAIGFSYAVEKRDTVQAFNSSRLGEEGTLNLERLNR